MLKKLRWVTWSEMLGSFSSLTMTVQILALKLTANITDIINQTRLYYTRLTLNIN